MNLEPIRRIMELAAKAKDQPSPDTANVSDAEYKLVCQFQSAVPALSQLLEAVTNLEKMEAEWREGANDPDGPTGGVFPQCADSLHRLLHPEDK